MGITSEVQAEYGRIVTADSLMLYAQGATDIYHAVLPFVTKSEHEIERLESENNELRTQSILTAIEKEIITAAISAFEELSTIHPDGPRIHCDDCTSTLGLTLFPILERYVDQIKVGGAQ